jgi:hypothetical protein
LPSVVRRSGDRQPLTGGGAGAPPGYREVMRLVALVVTLLAVPPVAGCARGGSAGGGEGATEPTGPRPGHGQVTGVVRDAVTGAPLAFAHVEARGSGGAALADDLTDADGRFTLDLVPGGYRIAARHGTASVVVPDVVVLERRTSPLALELEATPRDRPPTADGEPGAAVARGGVAGVVYDGESGERFPGAVIAVTGPALSDAIMAMSDERGQYRVLGLPPDTYQISVYYHLVDRGNLELRRAGVAVEAGSTTTVDLAIDLRVQR